MNIPPAIKVFFWGKGTPTDKEYVLLTPFHLFKKYRQFPLSILLHFFIVVFLSFQALLLSNELIDYGRANERSFSATFLPVSVREEGIYSIPDVVKLIADVVNNYYKFPAVSVGRYAHLLSDWDGDGALDVAPVILTVTKYQNLTGSFWKLPCPEFNQTNGNDTNNNYNYFFNSSSTSYHVLEDISLTDTLTFNGHYSSSLFDDFTNIKYDSFSSNDISGDFTVLTDVYNLTLTDTLGPFSHTLTSCDLQTLFYSLLEIKLSFTYESVNIGDLAVMPYYWDIDIYLTFEAGQITPQIRISHRIISISSSPSFVFFLLNIFLFFTSSLSGLLSIKSVAQNIRIFLRTKGRYQYLQRVARPDDPYPTWSSIPFKVIPLFFDLWSIFNAIGCIIVITSCLIGLLGEFGKDTSAIYMVIYGLGCMLACMNVLRYFEYFPSLYLHVLTLKNAAWHVITYLVSVLPIYWAFAIFGVLNYGPYSEKFSSIGGTLVTLFSLLNGDDIYATFTEIEDGQYPLPLISRVYLFCFVTLFITSVLNVFIFIIEDSYRTAKLYTRSSEENIDDDHQSLHVTSTSAKEILERIFINLEIWQDRLENYSFHFNDLHENQSPRTRRSSIQDILDDDPISKLDNQHVPLRLQFHDFSNAKYDIDDKFVQNNNNTSKNRNVQMAEFGPLRHIHEDEQSTSHNREELYSILKSLETKIAEQNFYYSEEIKRREHEFQELKNLYESQNRQFQSILDSLISKKL